jgi:hypothetical protein
MKNSTTTSKFPLPTGKQWGRLPERVKKLEDAVKTIPEAPKYKVYTALLTQIELEVSDIEGQYSGTLIIGRTYEILDVGDPAGDWTNVGAPNNELGTKFVATGTTPNSWGDGGGLSYNSGAPVVTVLENTIGDIWFTYEGAGSYSIKSNSLFIINKTTFSIGILDDNEGIPIVSTDRYNNDANTYQFNTTVSSSRENGLLYNTLLEIRVYN